jgi:hypothetical protein
MIVLVVPPPALLPSQRAGFGQPAVPKTLPLVRLGPRG